MLHLHIHITQTLLLLLLSLLLFISNRKVASIDVLERAGDRGIIAYCYSIECVETVIHNCNADNGIVGGIITRGVQSDAYLTLYLGWLVDIFELSPYRVHFVIYDTHDQGEYIDHIVTFLSLLPVKSMIFTPEHGPNCIGLKNLGIAKTEMGIGPSIILHMNHERPWETSNTQSMDYIFPDIHALNKFYLRFHKVFRNYFYYPLTNSSVYFPVGPSHYGTIVGNYTNEIYMRRYDRASRRPHACRFQGRSDYEEDSNDMVMGIHERKQLYELYMKNQTGSCVVTLTHYGIVNDGIGSGSSSSSSSSSSDTLPYSKYLQDIVSSTFTLCPAGNNRETFRLYESLELGSIPLFVRPSADQPDNFMSYGLWHRYPGPVFYNWSELQGYMDKMTASGSDVIDTLQLAIRQWYEEFLDDIKVNIAGHILQIWEIDSSDDNSSISIDSISNNANSGDSDSCSDISSGDSGSDSGSSSSSSSSSGSSSSSSSSSSSNSNDIISDSNSSRNSNSYRSKYSFDTNTGSNSDTTRELSVRLEAAEAEIRKLLKKEEEMLIRFEHIELFLKNSKILYNDLIDP